MWEFRNRNVFGATAFSTYGGFWLGLGGVVVLASLSKTFAAGLAGANLTNALAWFLIAFAIFNTYMMLWALRVNVAVFAVFLTLEITEIVLAIGFFKISSGGSEYILHLGGWIGIVTAATAWYTSAAGVVNGMSPVPVLPVGAPLWGRLPAMSRPGSPTPRRGEV
jgi:succinate-acetate transporter protein